MASAARPSALAVRLVDSVTWIESWVRPSESKWLTGSAGLARLLVLFGMVDTLRVTWDEILRERPSRDRSVSCDERRWMVGSLFVPVSPPPPPKTERHALDARPTEAPSRPGGPATHELENRAVAYHPEVPALPPWAVRELLSWPGSRTARSDF
jgi:hypothetical protein